MFRKFSYFIVTLLIAGSAHAQVAWTGRDVEAPQVRTVGNVSMGTVLEVVQVRAHDRVTDTQRGIGSAVGALLGAAAAHRQGGATQAVAAVVGGLAGEHVTRRAGNAVVSSQEVIVALNDGRAISVVQAIDEHGLFQPGQPVYVVGANQTYDSYGRLSPVRVIPRQSEAAQAFPVR